MLIDSADEESHYHCALQALREPDECRDNVLGKFARLASQVLKIPGCFVSVLDERDQYIRAARNFTLKQTTRKESLCR
ncbi:MAG: histidine kinase, partial [Pantoea eucrina]|nr:histidine kinase [Pantoea eucrina]